jgi:hypothetical protein
MFQSLGAYMRDGNMKARDWKAAIIFRQCKRNPIGQLCVTFSWSSSFDYVGVAIIERSRQRTGVL